MNTWRIQSLEAQNLFRYQDVHVVFQPDIDMYLVVGSNEDSSGVDSNGSGKSTFFNIVSWVLFGRTPLYDNFDKIVRRGQDRGFSRIRLKSGDFEVHIERSKDIKGNQSLDFRRYENGNIIVEQKLRTNTLIQKQILQFFGYSEDMKYAYQDFLSQCYFSTASTKGFLSSKISPMDRQAVLERFLDLQVFDAARDLVKKDKLGLDTEKSVLEGKRQGIEEGLSGLESEEDLIEQVRSITGCLKIAEERKITCERSLSALEKAFHTLVTANNKVSGCEFVCKGIEQKKDKSSKDYQRCIANDSLAVGWRKDWEGKKEKYLSKVKELSELQETLLKLESDCQYAEQEVNDVRDQLLKSDEAVDLYEKRLSKASVCPSCDASLMIVGQDISIFDTAILQNKISEEVEKGEGYASQIVSLVEIMDVCATKRALHKTTIGILKSELESLEKLKYSVEEYDFSELDDVLEEAKGIEASSVKAVEDYKAAKKELDDLESRLVVDFVDLPNERRIQDEKTKLSSFHSQISTFGSRKVEAEISLDHRRDFESNLKDVSVELSDLLKKAEMLTYWHSAFPKIKRRVLSFFIPLFESTANRYLTQLDVVERVKFDLISETKSGKMSAGFGISVFDGEHWRDFDTFSQGEGSRILLSIGFALYELSVYKSGGSNFGFLFCDEVVDKIDSTGMSLFLGLLSSIDGQKFVVTHTKADEAALVCDGKLVVTRRNGISDVRVA